MLHLKYEYITLNINMVKLTCSILLQIMFRNRSNVKSIPDILFRFDVHTPLHDDISMVTPNLTEVVWITKWSSEHILGQDIGDLKRLLPIIICTILRISKSKTTSGYSILWNRNTKTNMTKFFKSGCEYKSEETRSRSSYLLKRHKRGFYTNENERH